MSRPAAKKRGGVQPGSGRPALDQDGGASYVVSLRLTAKQRATWEMIGAREWLRDALDRIAGEKRP